MKTCPQCHTPLDEDAPEGLCPRCLAAAAFHSDPTIVTGGPEGLPDIANAEEVARRLPQYEILELLGRGGMGVVYKARQRQLDRIVALKILPPSDAMSPDFIERFRREARSLAKLSHPNIVAIHDFGEDGGLYYFAMEFVDGVNLREMLRSKKMTAEEALAVVPKICDALQYAHEEGVVHRDIKPENILVDARGRVKIADFGLAKLLCREQNDLTLTLSGMSLGTPRYMAPEQVDKPETVDHRADIYSLGVVFYEMLTGEIPMGRFAPPSEMVHVDVRLDEIVLRTLERDVERRYQHVSEVRTAVENVIQPVTALPRAAPTTVTPSAKRVRALGELLLLVASVSLLTALGIGGWLWAETALHPESNFRPGHGQQGFAMIAMAVVIAGYGLFISAAGLFMRRLRGRMFVLICLVLVGFFIPAALALNCIQEAKNIPQWPALIPLWLGVPVAVWALVVLFRDDVRESFASTAGRPRRAVTGEPITHAQINARGLEMMIAGLALGLSGLIGFIYEMVMASRYSASVTNPADDVAGRAALGGLAFLLFLFCGIAAFMSGVRIRKLRFHSFALVMSSLLMASLPALVIVNHGPPPQILLLQVAFALYAGIRSFLLLRKPEIEDIFSTGRSDIHTDTPRAPGAWTPLEITAVATTSLAFLLGGVNALFDLAQNSSPIRGVTLAAIIFAAVCAATLLIVQQFRPAATPARAALPELFFPALAACTGGLAWTVVFKDVTGWNFWHGAAYAALNFVLALFLLITSGAGLAKTRALIVMLTGMAGFALVLWWNAVPVGLIGDNGGFLGSGSGPITINRKPTLSGAYIAAALAVLTTITGALRLRVASIASRATL